MISALSFKDERNHQKDGCVYHTDEMYFMLLDIDLQIITFNKAFSRIIKKKRNRNSRNLLECIDNVNKHWFIFLSETAKKGKSIQQEILISDEEHRLHWLRFDVSPTFDINDEICGISFIGKNVDKEKSQEEKIEMQKLLLREIASTYSHELRHPLTNILSVINLIRHDNLQMSELYFRCLETATRQMDEVIKTVANQLYNAA